MLDRNVDMLTTGHRHPFLGKYKVDETNTWTSTSADMHNWCSIIPVQAGFTEEGRITALQLQLYANAGYSLDLSAPVSLI